MLALRSALAAAVVLVGASVHTPAAPEWKIMTSGFGPVRVGMTVREASDALGVKLAVQGPLGDGEDCQYATPESGLDGVAFMLIGGRVARVDVDSKTYTTPTGAHVGMTEREIKALYPGRVRVTPHAYVDGHYLTYTPRDARDRRGRIVFETDGGRVTHIRAGRLPEVEYIEGCS
jgi:hypothetical protein